MSTDAEGPLPIEVYNDGGYTHEAMHTVYVLMETFEAHVIDTHCAEQFPDVKAAADRVHAAMFDLYQMIGSKMESGTCKSES